MKMMALNKFNYGTRRLQAGDEFDAAQRDCSLMVPLGLARPIEHPQSAEITLESVSEKFRAIFGRPPDGRWGMGRIQKEIEAARGRK